MITVLFFGRMREMIGTQSHQLVTDTQESEATAGVIFDRVLNELGQSREQLDSALVAGLRCAINQTMADFGDVVADGDELAFFPPVTGG